MMQSFYVGNLLTDSDEQPAIARTETPNRNEFVGFSSPFIDFERNLALFLGLFNNTLYKSLPIGQEELICAKWTSPLVGLLSGGLISDSPLNTLTEEKVAVIEMTSSVEDYSRNDDQNDESTDNSDESILNLLTDNSKLQNQKLKVFLSMLERLCRDNHLLIHMNFPEDHPVEEVGRVLMAVLLKYQGLEKTVHDLIDREIENPGGFLLNNTTNDVQSILVQILKAVHQLKWKLVRIRQEHSKSYKEVCSSVLERCRFLLSDIRPVFNKNEDHKSVKVLKTVPKLKTAVKKILQKEKSVE